MDRCDVVIVNYNAGNFLEQAVTSVLLSPIVNVIIVDNASTDNSLDLVSGIDERVKIIHNPANLGFGAACNIGIRHSIADNVLLLNPDCRMIEGAIEQLLVALRSADRIGMAGPLLLNPDGSEQTSGRRKFPTPRFVTSRFLNAMGLRGISEGAENDICLPSSPNQPIKVEAISGACMMVRREAIAEVGLLNEDYFLHFEDLDWCLRFFLSGWKVVFVPAARVVHVKGVSSRLHPLAVEYYKHRGLVRFYRNFPNENSPSWLRPLIVGALWVRFAVMAVNTLSDRYRR